MLRKINNWNHLKTMLMNMTKLEMISLICSLNESLDCQGQLEPVNMMLCTDRTREMSLGWLLVLSQIAIISRWLELFVWHSLFQWLRKLKKTKRADKWTAVQISIKIVNQYKLVCLLIPDMCTSCALISRP